MKKIVRLTESDLARIVKRVIKEDMERYTLDEVLSSKMDGANGTWRVENGSLILNDGTDLEMLIVNAD
jgi:hypothetical protein